MSNYTYNLTPNLQQAAEQFFKLEAEKQIAPTEVVINVPMLKQGSLSELVKLAFYSNKKRFIQAFAEKGVIFVDDPQYYKSQLERLVYLGNIGGDLGGKLRRDKSMVPIHFSVKDTIMQMGVHQIDVVNSGVKFVR